MEVQVAEKTAAPGKARHIKANSTRQNFRVYTRDEFAALSQTAKYDVVLGTETLIKSLSAKIAADTARVPTPANLAGKSNDEKLSMIRNAQYITSKIESDSADLIESQLHLQELLSWI